MRRPQLKVRAFHLLPVTVKSKERIVFVKQFGGYAMQDSVWMKEADKFRSELSERSNEVDLSYFWTAGYDSPMKFWNRRNEIMYLVPGGRW